MQRSFKAIPDTYGQLDALHRARGAAKQSLSSIKYSESIKLSRRTTLANRRRTARRAKAMLKPYLAITVMQMETDRVDG
ncbi:MAG: hypothetical protein APF80_16665 [Alphaproteobacteria bacterium BRH_c36]|nr:MAG: hypothetical protein APF80_16665 [Alphaproteobacteria bacterium BRH_c36]